MTPLNDAPEEVRIYVNKDDPVDATVIVNGRKLDAAIRYEISQNAGEPVDILITLRPRHGVLVEALRARLKYETACPACGFTHRQATLPISETDYERLEKVFYAYKDSPIGDPDIDEYGKALLGDIRATLDAFSPKFLGRWPESEDVARDRLQTQEIEQGRPSADSYVSPPGVDRSRAAYAEERRGNAEEEGETVSGQADAPSSGPSGGGDREEQNGDSNIQEDPDSVRIQQLSKNWPRYHEDDDHHTT